MTNNTTQKKIVAQAVSIFENVNEKISSLIECSVKDFELLNTNFKRYYNHLQVISKASNNFITFLSEVSANATFHDLKSQIDIQSLQVYIKANDLLNGLKESNKKSNYIKLLLNNLNQDLSTIKLLFNNLKFDPLFNTDLSEINQSTQKLSVCLSELIVEVNENHQKTSSKIKFVEKNLVNSFDLLIDTEKEIEDAYQQINNLTTSALKYSHNLSEIEKKRLSSTSEIITRLQFQDILRQKIEHVQEAYEDITFDLKKAHEENSPLKPEEQFKIRDIATLQSAQLIHSSQEYQSAVETILNRISELNTFLNNYQVIWNHFCKPGTNKLNLVRTKIEELLEQLENRHKSITGSAQELPSLETIDSKTKSKISGILDKNNNMCNSFMELKTMFIKVEKHYTEDENNSAFLQIKQEFGKFDNGFTKLKTEAGKYQKAIENESVLFKDTIGSDFGNIDDLVALNITFFKNNISGKINALYNDALNIDNGSEFDVEQVAYYKTFEKEIQEIIILLDNLLEKISVNKADIDEDRLEHLKSIYTMDSERKIHDLITGATSEENTEDNDDNDEVEFF